MSRLREITALGQAVWINNLNRALIEDGHLRRLIDEDGLSGVTSNPSIFEKAMGAAHRDRRIARSLAQRPAATRRYRSRLSLS